MSKLETALAAVMLASVSVMLVAAVLVNLSLMCAAVGLAVVGIVLTLKVSRANRIEAELGKEPPR